MTALNIVPECYVDTKVAELVVRSSEKFNHQHGCGQIANELKNKLKNVPAIGIIDEDKNKGPAPKYFLEFYEIRSTDNLILKRHNEKLQFLIIICPEIEKWLLVNARLVNINPINYNLSENLEGLKKATKTQNIDRNIGFYQFIKALIKGEAPGIITLKDWIEEFNRNKFIS